ncbi:MAG TPA: tetratricopeptide repeat protein [Myxococcales bacterium]|nr:tetratricopeptide repeat protein [Myxococcales bacterium]
MGETGHPDSDEIRRADLGRRWRGFVAELRRRGVLRAVLAYAVVAFAILQVIEPVLHGLRLPDWFLTVVIAILGVGLPVTVVVSWVFNLTPRGFERDSAAARGYARGRAPLRPLLAAAIMGAVLGALLVWGALGLMRDEPRLSLAAADFVNETHDDDLNALSGLLITSLEQSRRLSVMTRSRMFDVLKQLGRGNAERIDETLGREICTRAQVDALVLASIRKFGELYTIDLKVIDPARNEHLFAAREEGRGKESIPAMIDRLGERTRAGLRERSAAISASRKPVSGWATANLEAYRHFFRAEELLARGAAISENPLTTNGLSDELRAAIRLDPDFAVAHFRLGFARRWEGARDALEETEIALAHADRLPPNERCHALAMRTGLRGDWLMAIRLIQGCAEQFPDDKLILIEAGDWLFHRGELGLSIRYFEKTLAIDPAFVLALEHLLTALRDLERGGETLERARAYAALTADDTAFELLAFAYGISEGPEQSLEAVRLGLSSFPRSARLWLATARGHLFAGRVAEAEAADRTLSAIDGDAARWAKLRMYAYRGQYRRLAAANEEAAAKALASGDRERAAVRMAYKAFDLAFGFEDRAGAALAASQAESFGAPSGLFRVYRWLGMAEETAASLSSPSPPVSGDLHLAAVRARTSGPLRDAIRAQEKLASTPDWKHSELYDLARLYLEAEQPGKAIATLQRLQRTYPGVWGMAAFVHSYPRSFYLLGRAYEAAGQPAAALEAYRRFLAIWKDADAELKEPQDAHSRVRALSVAAR